MSINVRELEVSDEIEYERLVQSCPWAMLYHSLKYRNLLLAFLPDTEPHYLLAYRGEQLVGALPSMMRRGPLGPVVNSLPFFGSHGGILLETGAGSEVVTALADAFVELCLSRNVAFATLIDTPFTSFDQDYSNIIGTTLGDNRVGQFTMLPEPGLASTVEASLMAMYHQKTRNIVRKAMCAGFAFNHDGSMDTINALQRMHSINIEALGGMVKPPVFFEALTSTLEYGKDYRVYSARAPSGEIVSALLLLYHAGYVEYFVPATDLHWRTAQPLSGLIFVAMRDAVVEFQSKVWNWGGTWLSQDGVYHFKSRWGTADFPYRYHTRVFADIDSLRDLGRDGLLAGYPWFYTVPFSMLTP